MLTHCPLLQYNLYGPEAANGSPTSHHHHHHHRGRGGFYEYDPTHGFEADMTAEEIFNMFFGGGFPSQTVYMRRGQGQGGGAAAFRRQAHYQRHFNGRNNENTVEVSGRKSVT